MPANIPSFLGDSIFVKIGVTVVSSGIMVLLTNISSLNSKIIVFGERQAVMAESIEELSEYMDRPVFTREDFITNSLIFDERINNIAQDTKGNQLRIREIEGQVFGMISFMANHEKKATKTNRTEKQNE